ncbi:MAG: PQQ-binding-like beta-propeller repeat protein [Opitutae bacterium]|nr:PQQ-binding-like beta-propeller repeat protein [Opitutae bacterium]
MRGFPLIFILLHLTATAKDTPLEKWHSEELDLIGDQAEGRLLRIVEEGRGLPQMGMTVEAWVLVRKTARWGGILSAIQDNGAYERGWLLGYENDHFCFALASDKTKQLTYLKAKEPFVPGFWYHVAGSYDGKEQRIYLDGKLTATSTAQSGPLIYPPKLPFTLGAYRDDNEQYNLAGQIASAAIWNRALTPVEILQHFDSRKKEFHGMEPAKEDSPLTGDWPTYQHDNQRSGRTSVKLNLPLHLQWTREIQHPPKPAWPPPAKQDFWHNKFNLQPRVTYDRAFHVVGDGNRLFLGSSADDQVHCLDRLNGKTIWTFFAGGPVRLAPTLAGKKLLFGSDDGHAYCLEATTGKLLWKTPANNNPNRRIPGNGRLISPWPVRSSIIVDRTAAYLCSGIFPNQGAWHLALDVRNGKIIDQKPIQFSPQGYLSQRGEQFHIPTGRDTKGKTISAAKRRGNKTNGTPPTTGKDHPFAAIATSSHRIAGGENKVAAFDLSTTRKVWEQTVNGRAYSLSIIGGSLIVSTDTGSIHCFGTEKVVPKIKKRVSTPQITQPPTRQVTIAMKHLKNSKGYALVLGVENLLSIRSIIQSTDLRITIAARDSVLANKLRAELATQSLYGSRVTVHQIPEEEKLPYSDYLFNLIIEDENGSPTPINWVEDIPRLLQPINGVAVLRNNRVLHGKPVYGAGEWTHIYANPANTACSMDQRVSGKLNLQWFGLPGPEKMLDRHHRSAPPLWKKGRIFVPGNERVYGVDAYNGMVLWEQEVPGSRRVGIFRDCGSMAASSEAFYIAANNTCQALSPETGKTLQTFTAKHPSGQPVHWGLVAYSGNLLVGSTTIPEASRKTHSVATIREGTYFDNRPAVTSNSLFAINRKSGANLWQYVPKSGSLLNPTLTLAEGKAFFLESRNPETLKSKSGRSTYTEFAEANGADLVALDLGTGKEAWRQPLEFPKGLQNSSLLSAKGRLVLQYSRNEKTVRYDTRAFDANSGDLLWSQTQDNRNRAGGDHGEQDHHPVIIGNKLIIEPLAYELETGKRLPEYDLRRNGHGCGTMSASASSLYFRASNPTEYLLKERRLRRITTISRPGCWINIIPAGGLVLIPEASSGCTCNFAVQASMAFLPTGKD